VSNRQTFEIPGVRHVNAPIPMAARTGGILQSSAIRRSSRWPALAAVMLSYGGLPRVRRTARGGQQVLERVAPGPS
jgi:hypothetical protein